MRWPRVPIGALMLMVAFAALVAAEVRSFLAQAGSSQSGIVVFLIGPSLLLGSNLLSFLILLRLPRLWRNGRVAGSFWFGFQAAGWTALGLTMLVGWSSAEAIGDYVRGPVSPTLEAWFEWLGNMMPNPFWGGVVEFALFGIVFSMPALILATLGGLVAWALGIEVELRIHRRRPLDLGADESTLEPRDKPLPVASVEATRRTTSG